METLVYCMGVLDWSGTERVADMGYATSLAPFFPFHSIFKRWGGFVPASMYVR